MGNSVVASVSRVKLRDSTDEMVAHYIAEQEGEPVQHELHCFARTSRIAEAMSLCFSPARRAWRRRKQEPYGSPQEREATWGARVGIEAGGSVLYGW